jgi:hypothetical protein
MVNRVLGSAKLCGHDPHAYLRDVLRRLPEHPGHAALMNCCRIAGIRLNRPEAAGRGMLLAPPTVVHTMSGRNRMVTVLKPLAPGRYDVRCKEPSRMNAASNGHAAVWPQAEAISDGKWVQFYRDGKPIYDCNATYAAGNFVCTKR